MDFDLLSRWSHAFCCFAPFCGSISLSSNSKIGHFFFGSGLGRRLWSAGGRGRGGRRLTRVWTLGASGRVAPLPLLAIKPLKLGLFLRSIASTSSDLISIKAMAYPCWWAVESLSNSVSESKISTNLSGVPSLANWNLSISSSSDKCEKKATSSATWATARGTCWRGTTSCGRFSWVGNTIGGKSRLARKPSLETSIRARRGVPAFNAWPVSWYMRQGLVTQDKVCGPQLPILAHKYLRPQQKVEPGDVNAA